MPRAPLPSNEAERLAALHACYVLDTAPEAGFDELTTVAAAVCDVPIALVSLIDAERQWFKSKVGMCVAETSRDVAFCAYAIQRDEPLIIPDASLDERTRDNPLVTGEPFIRFYAGVPLRNAEGFALGTLCVIDTKPRELTTSQLDALKLLARQAVVELELRRRTATSRRVREQIVRSRFHLGPAVLGSFAVGLAITALAVWNAHASIGRLAQQRFERLGDSVRTEITRRANLPIYGMKGARGVYAASKSVERTEFREYVASRDLPREFPGVFGFGIIERTPRADLTEFLNEQRADEAPDFAVRAIPGVPLGDADDLYLITRSFPYERNAGVWGLDVGSDPGRRASLERAIRTGEPTVSAPIRLIQDAGRRRGFLYFVPVYRNGTSPQTPDERMAALRGVLFAPVILDDALATVFGSVDAMLDFEIYDGDAPAADGTVGAADRRLFSRAGATSDGPALLAGDALSMTYAIEIGGRRWSVRTVATPRFTATIDRTVPWVAGIGGTVLSVLLSTLIWSLGRSRARAVALADGMTADLRAAKDLAVRSSQDLAASALLLRRTGEMARVGGWEIDLLTKRVTWGDEVYRIHELDVGVPMTVERAVGFYSADAREFVEAALGTAIDEGKPWDFELPLRTAKGRQIFVRAQGEVVREGGVAVKLRGAFQDVTQRREAQEQLRHIASHDKLTGLPNRSLLTERLQDALALVARRPARTFGVLFMDFDRFKLTNDTLGHDAGDDLLKQIAGRLRGCLEPDGADDACAITIGRLGGDEFVVILGDLAQASDAIRVADRLLVALAEPYRIFGHEVVSTASIGVVTHDPRYARPDELLRDADIAMYEAKLAGKGRHVVFDDAMYRRVQQRVATETDLRAAVANGELSLAFQPILSMESGAIGGVETLVRWHHPTRGTLGPEAFLPIAEESNLILPLGEWVLRAACEQYAAWQRTLGDRVPPGISVNVSRKQMATRGLAETVARILRETGVPPACLHLEIAESAMMKDPALAKALLAGLRAVGVKIDMDNFGIGQSSLATLHEFPIDRLKIDRAFIANLDRGREFAAIVQAVAQMARNLGIGVVAEGIETADQLVLLQALDCPLGQGYWFGQPLTATALEQQVCAPTSATRFGPADTAAAA